MFSTLFVAVAAILLLLCVFANTIYVPTVQSRYVQLGMIDATDPMNALDNKPYRDLVASGVLDVENETLSPITEGGDSISIPAPKEPADFAHTDHTSDVDLTPGTADAVTDVGVIVHDNQLTEFKRSDRIRSGFDFNQYYSMAIGAKIAKRHFEQAMRVAVAAVDAVDTPTANCHTLDVFNGTIGSEAYPTVARLQALKALAGDSANRLTTMVIHSIAWNKLLDDILTNYKSVNIADEAAVRGSVAQILGIANIIVSDLVPVVAAAGNDQAKYNTLLLGPKAIWSKYQQQPEVETQGNILKPSSRLYLKVAMAYCMHLRFVKWASTGNPTDTNLGTAANWDEAYSGNEHKRVVCYKLVSNGVAEVA